MDAAIRKVFAIAVLAFVLAVAAYIQGGGIITNHASLTNLTWSTAGHSIDTDLVVGGGGRVIFGDRMILENTVGSQAMLAINARYDGTWRYINDGFASAIRMNQDTGDIWLSAAPYGTAGSTITTWDSSAQKLYIYPNGDVKVVNGNLIVVPLAGSGNAYACIDSAGTLYRSATPCL